METLPETHSMKLQYSMNPISFKEFYIIPSGPYLTHICISQYIFLPDLTCHIYKGI